MLAKTRIAFVTVTLLGVFASASKVTLAETPGQRQACIGDAFQFCQSAIPDQSAATIPRAMSSSSYSGALMLRYGMLLWCVIFFLWVLTRRDDALAGLFGFFSRAE